MNRSAWGVLYFFVMCVMLFPAGRTALAQSTNTGEYTLGEIVVSAPTEAAKATQTERVVTAKEIRERGARNLAQALELLPGLNIRTAGDGIPRVDIRGFRTRDVVLLLNGTPFNSTFDGQFDPSSISVENIAKIELISGGASVLYGPGGIGGVINIITKTGRPGLHGSLQGQGGQGSEYLGAGTLSGGKGKLRFFASASTLGRDGFPMPGDWTPTAVQGDGLRDNSDLARTNAFGNVQYTPSDKTTLGITYNFIQDAHGIPPFVGTLGSEFAPKKDKYERIDDSQNNSVQFALNHSFEGPFSLKAWAYYNQLNMLENIYDNANYDSQVNAGSSSTQSTTSIAGANIQLRGDFGTRGIATVAFMSEVDKWTAGGFQMVNSGGSGSGGGSGGGKGKAAKSAPVMESINEDFSYKLFSGLFQYEISPIKNLGLVAGLGLHEQVRAENSHGDYSYVLGAYYDLFKGTRLKIDTSRKVRFPTLRDLYNVGNPQGNPNLVPEWSLNYEAGIEQVLPAKTRVSITGFIIDAHNFIEADSNNVSQNHAKYLFRGFEITAENRYIHNLLLQASYSFLYSKNDDPGVHTDKLQYRPENKVTLQANYFFPHGLSLNGTLLYVSNQYTVSNDDLQALKLPSYTVVNLKLDKTLMNRALDMYVGVDNLFDQNYEDAFGFPMAGRMIYGGMTYRF